MLIAASADKPSVLFLPAPPGEANLNSSIPSGVVIYLKMNDVLARRLSTLQVI
ncbi:hypothetical protein D3C71_2183320 [compost metagenome]